MHGVATVMGLSALLCIVVAPLSWGSGLLARPIAEAGLAADLGIG